MATPMVHDPSAGQQNVHTAGNTLSPNVGVVSYQIPAATARDDGIAPESMPQTVPLAANEEYSKVFKAFFATLRCVGDNGHAMEYVRTIFLTMADADLEPLRATCNQLARIKATPSDLYKVLDIITNGIPKSLRGSNKTKELVDVMVADKDVTALLKSLFKQADTVQGDDLVIMPFWDWCHTAKLSLMFLGKKYRYAVEALTLYNKAQAELDKLTAMYDELTQTLCNRETVNREAQYIVWLRRQFVDAVSQYLTLHEEAKRDNGKLYLPNLRVTTTFVFADIERRLSTSVLGIWEAYVLNKDIEVYSLDAYKVINNRLAPYLEKIRTFTPTPYEQCLTRAAYLSPQLLRIKRDVDSYLASDTPTLGKGQSLVKQMDNMRSCIQNLQLSGLNPDEQTLGLSLEHFEDLYAQCHDLVTAEESKKNLKDHRNKMEAQELAKSSIGNANLLQITPLTGINTWLSFWRSHCEIIKLHDSDQIRKAVTLKALKVKEDKQACIDLTYEEVVKWLQAKYNDPNLIPRIVEALKKLPKATSDKISYQNLTQFSTVVNQLKLHQSLSKLDKSTRHDLQRVLLGREHWMDFIKAERDFEKKLKDEYPDTSDLNDAASVVSLNDDDDKEIQRRDFYITSMEEFLYIVRAMVTSSPDSKSKNSSKTRGYAQSFEHSADTDPANYVCVLCNVTHKDKIGNTLLSLSRCKKFQQLSIDGRHDLVNKFDICKRCLEDKSLTDHKNGGCRRADKTCPNHPVPSNTHHPLLCFEKSKSKETKKSDTPKSSKSKSKKTSYRSNKSRGNVSSSSTNNPNDAPANNAAYTYQIATPAQPPLPVVPIPTGQVPTPVASQPQVVSTPAISTSQQTGNHMVNPTQGQAYPPPQVQWVETARPAFTPRLLSSTRANLSNTAPPFSHDCDYVRDLMSCATYVTALANTPSNDHVTCLAMQDTGSGLGFVTFKAAKKLNLPKLGDWQGTIMTLDGNREGSYPIFELIMVDVTNQHQLVRLLGVPWIGSKRRIPDNHFVDMCYSFGLDPGACQNTEGEFDILLGVDSCHLLADKARSFVSTKHPEAAVYYSILSPLYFILGASGAQLGGDHNVRTCAYRCDQLGATNYYLPHSYIRAHASQALLRQF